MGDQAFHWEVNFLILHALRSGPCSEAADLLERQLAQHGLLPTRTDVTGKQSPCRVTAPESVQLWLGLSWSRLSAKVWSFSFLCAAHHVRCFHCIAGRQHQLSYDALATRFRGLGSDTLQRMLQQLLVSNGLPGSTTLLGSGWFPTTLPITISSSQCPLRKVTWRGPALMTNPIDILLRPFGRPGPNPSAARACLLVQVPSV